MTRKVCLAGLVSSRGMRFWRCGAVASGALILAVTVAATPVGAQDSTAENARIVDGLSDHLAEVRDLSAEFVQIFDNGLNQSQREEGHLYVERSGRSRWEYDYPETRIYVVDRNVITDYLPAENLLRRRSADEDVFDRIPLMSIIGQQNLEDEFERIELITRAAESPVPGTRVLRLVPRRETDIEDIVIEVDPSSFDIRRLLMRYRNGSTNDLMFTGILTNTGLTDALWEVIPAPDTDILEIVD